ncbi:MAG: hypothetical protein ACOH2Q_24335, partial [Rhodococcus sp. (in: high G+C Gram-positive bacteria)]
MADRHENNWQPVRPLDEDPPEDHAPARTPPIDEAAVVTLDTEPDAKPEIQREPFRSTPITMPPESIDNPPIAPPEATRTTVMPPPLPVSGPPESAVAAKTVSGSTTAGGNAENGKHTAVPESAAGAAVAAEVSAVPAGVGETAAKAATSPKSPAASRERPSPVQERPATRPPEPLPSAPVKREPSTPEAKQIQTPPMTSTPLPPGNSTPMNSGPPHYGPSQNNWAPQNSG